MLDERLLLGVLNALAQREVTHLLAPGETDQQARDQDGHERDHGGHQLHLAGGGQDLLAIDLRDHVPGRAANRSRYREHRHIAIVGAFECRRSCHAPPGPPEA